MVQDVSSRGSLSTATGSPVFCDVIVTNKKAPVHNYIANSSTPQKKGTIPQTDHKRVKYEVQVIVTYT